MAKPLVTNNAYSTLASGITDSDLSLTVASGHGARFPTISGGNHFYATLIDTSNNIEIVQVTARSTDTFTIVRAQDNTSAQAYSADDRIELRPTAAMFEELSSGVGLTPAGMPADVIETAAIADANVTFAKLASAALASSANLRAGAASVLITPDVVETAQEPVTITHDGATTDWAWSDGINFELTMDADTILDFPTAVEPGTWRAIRVIQNGTGGWTLSLEASNGYYSVGGSDLGLNETLSTSAIVFFYAVSTSVVYVFPNSGPYQEIT